MVVKRLPQELYGVICQDPSLERRDLHVLCAVNRLFQSEAERLLYASAKLRGARRIKSWCIAVLRRNYLAERVNKLMLLMPPQLDLEADDLTRITRALHLCANLRELYVLVDEQATGLVKKRGGDAVQYWILHGHPFKLKRFMNTYFQSNLLVQFLRSQPTLETLVMRCPGGQEICDAPLPLLKTLDSSAQVVQEFTTKVRRKIVRLQFELAHSTDAEELATLAALTQVRETLKSLSIIRREATFGLNTSVLASCVASELPDIEYLRILDYTSTNQEYRAPILPFPVRFKKIETLILRPPMYASNTRSNRESFVSAYTDLRNPWGRKMAAERIMATLPTLNRLVIIGKECLEWKRNQEGTISDEKVIVNDEHDWMKVA